MELRAELRQNLPRRRQCGMWNDIYKYGATVEQRNDINEPGDDSYAAGNFAGSRRGTLTIADEVCTATVAGSAYSSDRWLRSAVSFTGSG
eukprot:2866597-Heterocapsa_arctica.AAC.1